MHSEVLIVAYPDRRPRIECSGGLAARSTESDTVHLISTAATPLGGDAISIRIVVEAEARLRIRSVAAMVTLPGADTVESHADWQLEVAGDLDIDPQPTVVAAASRHLTSARIDLAASSRLRFCERVQIGRSGEAQGFWSGSVHADVAGSALLRHRIELGHGSPSADAIATPLACISELRYPEVEFETKGVTLALAGGGALATWQGERL